MLIQLLPLVAVFAAAFLLVVTTPAPQRVASQPDETMLALSRRFSVNVSGNSSRTA